MSFFVALEIDGDGFHPAAWRFSHHEPDELNTASRVLQTVRGAERHGFSAVTVDDGLLPPSEEPGITARMDAVLRASFAAPLTSGVGLIPRAHTVFGEPFHLAGQFGSLDHASHGRAGWLVGVSGAEAEGDAYARNTAHDDEARRIAADVLRAARLLWDSWQDDAVILDRDSGRFLDRERLHYIDFVGEHFTVKGPSITPRPPQGQVAVFAELDTLPADLIDVAIVSGPTPVDVRAQAARARTAGIPRVLADVEVVLPVQGVGADDRWAELEAVAAAAPSSRLRLIADARSVTAELASLAEAVDGVRLHPAVLDVDGEELGRAVLPELRRLGLLRSPAPGQTLRASLGLDRPESVFATGRARTLHPAPEESIV